MVEAMVIGDGMLICEKHNITNIILKSNSRMLVDMLRVNSCPH